VKKYRHSSGITRKC